MRNRWVLIGLLLTITGIFVMGCYTILSHPGVQGEEEKEYSGPYYREHCTDCHADYHQYPYGYYYGYYPDYYWDYPRWGHYYMYPWWWDWYWPSGEGGGTAVPNERLEKRKRGLEPPYVGGTPGVYPPALTEPKSPREETPKGTVEEQKNPPTQQPPKKEEKKEEKIPKRKR